MKDIKLNDSNIITEGGEGKIYDYSKDQIIKIFKADKVDMKVKERKVENLTKMSNLPPEVIAPIEAVSVKGKFAGYIMKRISNAEEVRMLSNNKYIKANGVKLDRILEIVTKIANVLEQLHNMGIYIGDLNDQNILFDKSNNVYFIDVDSWSVGQDRCSVAMDKFKDPKLQGDQFNEGTDNYSFTILAWNMITRIHPFAGTITPDMSITERMERGISVINNPKVKIPRTIKSWANLAPSLIDSMDEVFKGNSRDLVKSQIENMKSNLKYCPVDDNFYYGKFTSCPWCDSNAKVVTKPTSTGKVGGLSIVPVLTSNISLVLNSQVAITDNKKLYIIATGETIDFLPNAKYYFMEDKTMIVAYSDFFTFKDKKGEKIKIKKRLSSNIITVKNYIYYIHPSNRLQRIEITPYGNGEETIEHVSYNCFYEVDPEGNYCIVNNYDTGKLLININGANKEVPYSRKIINYGIHYDRMSKGRWLIILEDDKGEFTTLVFKDQLEFNEKQIKYDCSLGNITFAASTIFIPNDGIIRGYNFQKQLFKDFDVDVVTSDSKLIRTNTGFKVINDENIYNVGA